MSCYMTYVQNMLYNMCHVILYNIRHVMLSRITYIMLCYSICSEYVIQHNRTCYMTYVMLYNMCQVMLYDICSKHVI